MYKHILLTTDGSEFAKKGVDHGLDLAKLTGARVTLVSVTEPIALSDISAAASGGVENPFARYEQQMDTHFRKVAEPIEMKAQEMGIAIETERDTDSAPAEAIVRIAERKGVDLIVMASHGRRGLSKLLLGSQTTEVLVRTKVPVLVVR